MVDRRLQELEGEEWRQALIRKVAKTAVGTKTGRTVSKKAIKTAAGTRTGRRALKAGAKTAGKVGVKAGKARVRRAAPEVVAPANKGWMKFGLVAVAGFALGALFGRSKSDGTSSEYTPTTGHHAPDPGSPAGRRGQTWGSGANLGSAGGGTSAPQQNRSQGSSAVGPTSAPLIGQESRPRADVGTELQQEVEQRVKTSFGEDPRTQNIPRVNVEVNDGVADLRGSVPSEAAKQAAGEIALATEGVREVRNLITVSS